PGRAASGMVVAAGVGGTFKYPDALHPPAEIAKMRSGVPLTDADRWPWLETVAAWMDQRIAAGESAVVACSALKRSYREFLYRGRPAVRIVILQVDRAALAARLIARGGHFLAARLAGGPSSGRGKAGAFRRNGGGPPRRFPRRNGG